MPRIVELSLEQINRQIDVIDQLHSQVDALRKQVSNVGQQIAVTDPYHAPDTTNNMVFTWTGGTNTLSWNQGYLKDKNWSAQIVSNPPIKSSAPGLPHSYAIPAGSLVLLPSTYYWMSWTPSSNSMQAQKDVSLLHGNKSTHVICQIFTGTGGQTGVAGGGGSTGGVDLSGARYKNF